MPLILICAAALCGVAVADLRPPSATPLVVTALLAVPAAALSWRQPAWRTLAFVALAAAVGALRTVALPAAPLPTLRLFDDLRESARSGITRYLPEPTASLAAGVLVGGSGHLSFAFRQDLRRSGLSHLVAIDGFKQVVVASVVRGTAARFFSARVAVCTSLGAIAAYTLLAGAHPSALRAALMVSMANIAALTGRVPDPLTSLLIAIALLAALDPAVLLDLGLQLSVSATLGIILLWPLVRGPLSALPRFISEPLGLSLAVTVACLPVTLTVFQSVSLISPIAHVAAVPLLPLVFAGTALLVLASPFPPLASVAAWLAWLPTAILAAAVHLFGSLPGASLATGHLPLIAACLLALSLLACGLYQELRSAPTTSVARPGSAG